MGAVIGVYDTSHVYSEKLAEYINTKKEVGYVAQAFVSKAEVEKAANANEIKILVCSDKSVSTPEFTGERFLLTDEQDNEENAVFKYCAASDILRSILPGTLKQEKKNIHTVYSPSSNSLAYRFAADLAEKTGKKEKTLFLSWEMFNGMGRNESADYVTVSELLFSVRKNEKSLVPLLKKARAGNGYDYLAGVEFYTDLWQYSAEDAKNLIRCCKEYGNYKTIVFCLGFFSETAEMLMNLSDTVYLVGEGKEEDMRNREFLRQMKYSGKHEILAKIREVFYEH